MTKQSHKKRLRLPRRYAPRNDNLLYEIATLSSVARNDFSSRNFGTKPNNKREKYTEFYTCLLKPLPILS